MIVLPHPRGHAVVAQDEHARMCRDLGRAWASRPTDDVLLAAEQHELGMVDWDEAPELDAERGLPRTVQRMRLEAHLPLRLEGPRRLAERSPYAALLASLHHVSFYETPPPYGLLRRRGRLIARYLRESRRFQSRLRTGLAATDEEIERDWRLVRRWDGMSHAVIHGSDRDLQPWPFASDTVHLTLEARLLEATFGRRQDLLRALAEAPTIELAYTLERPSTSLRSSESASPTG